MKARGATANPKPRFDTLEFEPDPAALEFEEAIEPRTRFLTDASRSVITRNNSPDIPFDFSLNPYRGCEHGCSYCYARPSHEYLGLSAGLDFERIIFVKKNAAQLLEAELRRKSRSEERRVGKECRCERSAEHEKKGEKRAGSNE